MPEKRITIHELYTQLQALDIAPWADRPGLPVTFVVEDSEMAFEYDGAIYDDGTCFIYLKQWFPPPGSDGSGEYQGNEGVREERRHI